MFQMIEQDKITARDLNETEISNIPDKEFKTTFIKILTGLKKRMEDLSKSFNKEKYKKESIKDELNN